MEPPKYLRGVTRVKRVERTGRAGPVHQFVHAYREKLREKVPLREKVLREKVLVRA
jgi:hypothetical protein